MRLLREQPQHTAGYHQLGDPCYYYVLSWASPPISLNGQFDNYVSGVNIAKFQNFGNFEGIDVPNGLILPSEGEDKRHVAVGFSSLR